jgi:hypothetical protein
MAHDGEQAFKRTTLTKAAENSETVDDLRNAMKLLTVPEFP